VTANRKESPICFEHSKSAQICLPSRFTISDPHFTQPTQKPGEEILLRKLNHVVVLIIAVVSRCWIWFSINIVCRNLVWCAKFDPDYRRSTHHCCQRPATPLEPVTQHHWRSRHADLSRRSPLNLQIRDTAQGSDPLLPSCRQPTRLPGTAGTLPVTQHTVEAALTLPRLPLVDPLPETYCWRFEPQSTPLPPIHTSETQSTA
jgi:hypothetical protein